MSEDTQERYDDAKDELLHEAYYIRDELCDPENRDVWDILIKKIEDLR